MRTYTRKRPVYQAIEGVTELCRLCLGSTDVTVPIFGEDADQLCATLSLRIMICVGLEMTRDNFLPNAICTGCLKELERCYTFRKKCEVTYQKLKAHVLAMKERQYNLLNMKPKKEEEVMPVETDDGHQQLVLTFDENQQMQLVNLVNSNSIQLGNSQNLFDPATLEIISNEIVSSQPDEEHIVTEPVQDSTTTSLVMSTMLLELGVLRQEDDRLLLVDDHLKTVELEGDDNMKIVLQLVEEDDESQIADDGCTKQNAKVNLSNSENTPTLLKDNTELISKEQTAKGKKADTTCAVCNKRFASRSILTRHARVHSGARPHACAACPRRFAQRAVLKRHELVHAEKRPFACSTCPKSFTQRGALELHARTHVPKHARVIALHSCTACEKVFLYASGLSRHMAVHSGRRFTCARCGRGFSDASALARHARSCARQCARAPHAQHAATQGCE